MKAATLFLVKQIRHTFDRSAELQRENEELQRASESIALELQRENEKLQRENEELQQATQGIAFDLGDYVVRKPIDVEAAEEEEERMDRVQKLMDAWEIKFKDTTLRGEALERSNFWKAWNDAKAASSTDIVSTNGVQELSSKMPVQEVQSPA
jgi:FtsZ-binding cell division protein ZapB